MSDNVSGAKRYRIADWGSDYVDVDDEGFVCIHPQRGVGPGIRLLDVVRSLDERGLHDPLLLRFPQILTDRRQRIRDAFQAAIDEYGYTRHYQGVFPVKVNHNRVVVETLVKGGYEDRFGLEVGSKAELCLALTFTLHPEALLVCNGFKDKDYLELAVHASRHGRRVLVIAENPTEVLEIIAALRSQPGAELAIGFRARLHSEGSGRWQESSGHKGKFGLSTMEILEGMEALDESGFLDRLHALHFHIGSQVCDILDLKAAIKEASRLYCSMRSRSPHLEILDLGGGLGVDYDGSRTASEWSVNYSIDEYARDSVYIVKDVCDRSGVEAPVIVTESGRALTAYHAMIVVSSLRVVGDHVVRDYSKYESKAHQIEDLIVTRDDIHEGNFREAYHDATQLLNELLSGFKLGYVGLEDRAVGECLHRDILFKVRSFMKPWHGRTRDMEALERELAPKYVCNFSIFMSAPDSWAVQQLFPVCPIERINDESCAPATIGDITCDSDGKMERFVGQGTPEPHIWLHPINEEQPYHIGMFLVGAYQDVLGDFHNLFGTVNEGVVIVDDDDEYSVVNTNEGSSVEHSLDHFGFSPTEMVRSFDRLIDRGEGREEAQRFKGVFLRVLHGGTYLQRL